MALKYVQIRRDPANYDPLITGRHTLQSPNLNRMYDEALVESNDLFGQMSNTWGRELTLYAVQLAREIHDLLEG